MHGVPISLSPDAKSSAERVVECLEMGGVVLVPTDTVLGLAALPTCNNAISKLYSLKNRPPEMRLPVMVASVDQLEVLSVDVTHSASRLLSSKFVPGPLTIAMGFSGDRPDWLAGRIEVAVRIPNDAYLLNILRMTGPLFVTSANAHGHSTPKSTEEAVLQLNGTPELVVIGRTRDSVPSTLVNCRQFPPVIEREGAVPSWEIEEYLA